MKNRFTSSYEQLIRGLAVGIARQDFQWLTSLRRCLPSSTWQRQLLLALGLLASIGFRQQVQAQGYIYLHKNTTDESSSPNFNFTVTGPGGFNSSYTLNDQHPITYVRDVGATGNGGLFAVAGNTATGGNYPIYYRAPNTTAWTPVTGMNGTRIDGGPGNTGIYMDNGGAVYYYNGTSSTNLPGATAIDVAIDKSGSGRVFHVSSSFNVYYWNATLGSWTPVSNLFTNTIDVTPTGKLVANAGSISQNVVISDFDGNNVVNLGSPSAGAATVEDVAVGDDGVIYASSGTVVYRYTGGYSAGGSWVIEPTSRNATRITGGNAGQIWAAAGSAFLPGGVNSIWSRTPGGFWIDDEVVRTTGGNSVLIPVTPGTYTVAEAANSDWTLGSIDVYDPTNNSTANVVSATSTVNVASGEVVHLTYRNFLKTNFPVVNTCSSAPYLEDFDTGTTTTLGGPLEGQTNYHHISSTTQFMNDGYYMVASNSAQAGNVYGNFNDHTTGNGTGQMMLVNASYDQGEFFRRRFTGLLPGTLYGFSAWIMNLNNAAIRPNVKFEMIDPTTQTVLATLNTGDITSVGAWTQFQLEFTTTLGTVDLVLRNNNIGGAGNDLALDDIRFGLAQPLQPTVSVTNPTCSTPGSVTVTNPVGVSLEYSIDGTTYQSNPVFSPVAPGSYSVTARYTNSIGCTTTPTSTTVNAPTGPTLGPISGTDKPCSAPTSSTYAYTNSTAGGVWSVSPTTVATINPSTGVLTTVTGASGTATITYTVTTGSSCTSTATFNLTVSPTGCTPMPVSLLSFAAQIQPNQTVRLDWKTSWEKGNKVFVIERSKDLLTFETVGEVSDVAGTSNSINSYQFVDMRPNRGTSYYRLIQIDQDGSRHVYQAVSVILNGRYGVSPNPVTGNFFTLELDEPSTANVQLVDLNGRSVPLVKSNPDQTTVTLNFQEKIATGVYILTVTERGTTRRYRLVIP